MPILSSAGRKGPDVRSDCFIQFEPRQTGGIEIAITSKVASMYGEALRRQALQVLTDLAVSDGRLEIDDAGALPWTVAARIECAVIRALYPAASTAELNAPPPKRPAHLPPFKPYCLYGITRDRMRRSRLYLPGNEPKFFVNAGLHNPDGIILDLEDSVAPTEKDAARLLVRNTLRQVNFYSAERMVRINQGALGMLDLEAVVPHNVHTILIPKVETAAQVIAVDEYIQRIINTNADADADVEKNSKFQIPNSKLFLMPIVESALGGINAYQIATASPNVVALAVGLEDYTADIGVQRTLEGKESFWLRSQVVNAARAAGIQPIDTVFSDVNDMESLRMSVLEAKALGFDGKGCIHPRQIAVVHQAFTSDKNEIEKALRIVQAFEEAQAKGLGVVALGSKMIDPPVVKRALRVVNEAKATGVL